MRFQCDNCGQIISVDDSAVGCPVTCGHCDRTNYIPQERFGPKVVISDYVIVRKIGVGRMATVYLAHQISLDRKVALKILEQELAEDSDFIMDFFREAKTAGKLNHPNIVQAYAVDEENGTYFIVMEYIKARSLKQILEEDGPLPLDHALKILHQVAEALSFIWVGHKLIHENVKPENILITSNDTTKLSDLGLSKTHKRREASIDYISPEKILGSKIDIRSDLYSLGITFYESLTGTTPFEGESDEEIRNKHLKVNPTSADKLRDGIPESYLRIIDKLLAKHPDDRYLKPSELIRDIKLARITKAKKKPRQLAKKTQKQNYAENKNKAKVGTLRSYLFTSLIVNVMLLVIILLVASGKTPVQAVNTEDDTDEMKVYEELSSQLSAISISTEKAAAILEQVNLFIQDYPDSHHSPTVSYWKQALEERLIRVKRDELRKKEVNEQKEASRLLKIVDDGGEVETKGEKKEKQF